ncbi:DctP family TRAP transporter solute-binding subunit [Telmatospirillum sp.]|uniref:DctP family TRAP transporter solute-binding subunit n=1 Tax=Telmatospirillum sp. TaxID=2079197 RepID=UPI002848E419|nr:DctP family TRAP transporter solute-binding subunit [Telmatospirillum sp.]MDR3439172.1 DctP family TRAP transporter solute-binding subunit [Telmatospirillum sp.]
MRRRELLLASVAMAVVAATGRAAVAAPQTVLRMGFTNSRAAQMGAGAVEFARQAELATNGRIRIELYPNGEAGGELEMVQDIALGALDMAFPSSSVINGIEPSIGIFDIPFLFRDVAHARAVLDSDIGKQSLLQLESHGIIGLAWGENGLRHVTTANTAVRKPGDLSGIKIRVPQSEVMVAGFKAFGADAQALAFPDLYPALASGSFQAEENPIGVILSGNFDRVQRYLNLTGHVYSPGLILIGKHVFERLSPEDQSALGQAAVLGAKASRDAADRSEKAGIDELRNRGMTVVSDVDRVAFADAMAKVAGDFEKRFGKDHIDAIRAFGQ